MRDDGYYWVKQHSKTKWVIAEWKAGCFWIGQNVYSEREFIEIDETKIEKK